MEKQAKVFVYHQENILFLSYKYFGQASKAVNQFLLHILLQFTPIINQKNVFFRLRNILTSDSEYALKWEELNA